MKIAITCRQLVRDLDGLRGALEEAGFALQVPEIEGQHLEGEALVEALQGCVGAVAGDDRFSAEVLARLPQLRVISKWGVGLDGIDRAAAEARGIVVANTPGAFDDEVADVAMAWTVTLLRRLTAAHDGVKAGRWPKPAGRSARGLRMGIVGLGGIGRALARRAATAGMETVGCDPDAASRAAAEAAGVRILSLEALLASSDVVSLHCPLTPETRHLLDARRLAAMKPGALIVNTGRGGLIDGAALAEALAGGHLGGAALDVFEEEPPPPSEPLLAADNVVFGSHNASNTLEASARVHRRALVNLARALGREIRFGPEFDAERAAAEAAIPAADEGRALARQGRVLLSVVVPCFDEEAVIREAHRRLAAALEGGGDLDFELIYVDDGSCDATLAMLREIQGGDRRVRALSLSRNFGHQIAVTAGLAEAAGEVCAVIDADLQDPPEVLLEMLQRWRQGADVAYGVRTRRDGETAFKRLTARLFYRALARLADVFIPLDSGDFRLMDRRVVDAFLAMPERDRFVRGMVAWQGFRQEPVPYRRAARAAGETKYPVRKMLRLAIDSILSFSLLPLRLAVWAGFLAAGLALAGIVYALAIRLLTDAWVSGWATVLVAVLFLGGVQLATIGILGEYVGRIYGEAKRRPLYLVKERLGCRPARPRGEGR